IRRDGGCGKRLGHAAILDRAPGRSAAPDHHDVPDSAVQVDVVPAVLAGRVVADVRVQRVTVVGGLRGAVGPGDRADLPGDPGPGRHVPRYRRPVGGAVAVADGLVHAVRGERVEGQALGVGEQVLAGDLPGIQRLPAAG